jgi:hypothetical protein
MLWSISRAGTDPLDQPTILVGTRDGGTRRHVMQDDTTRADLGIAADLDITEHFRPSA